MVDYPNNPPAGSSQFTSATPYRGVTTARPSSAASLMSLPSSSPAGGGYAEMLAADRAMRSAPAPAPTTRAAPLSTTQLRSVDLSTPELARSFLTSYAAKGVNLSSLSDAGALRAASMVRDAQLATGVAPRIISAYRTPEQQAQLYANYSGRTFNYRGVTYRDQDAKRSALAARPPGFEGHPGSRHNVGGALDFARGPALDWMHGNATAYGYGGIKGDYPHLQISRELAAGGKTPPAEVGRFVELPTPSTREAALSNRSNQGMLGYAPDETGRELESGGAAAAAAREAGAPTPPGGVATTPGFDERYRDFGGMDLNRLRTGGYAWGDLPQDARAFVLQKYGPGGQAAYERWQTGLGGARTAATPPVASTFPARPEVVPTGRPGPVAANVPTPRENPRLQLGTGQEQPTYTVMPGDTLYDIAIERFGDPNMAAQIASHNGIRNPRSLQPGQTLKLPTPAANMPSPRPRPDPASLGAGAAFSPLFERTMAGAKAAPTADDRRIAAMDFGPAGGSLASAATNVSRGAPRPAPPQPPQLTRQYYIGEEGGAPGSRGTTGSRDYAAELRRGTDYASTPAGEPPIDFSQVTNFQGDGFNTSRGPDVAFSPGGGFRSGSAPGRVDLSRTGGRVPMDAQAPYPNPFALRSRETELRSLLQQRALDDAMRRRQVGGL